jgi:hypothetical protein
MVLGYSREMVPANQPFRLPGRGKKMSPSRHVSKLNRQQRIV